MGVGTAREGHEVGEMSCGIVSVKQDLRAVAQVTDKSVWRFNEILSV